MDLAYRSWTRVSRESDATPFNPRINLHCRTYLQIAFASTGGRVGLIGTTKSQYYEAESMSKTGLVSRGFVNPCHVTRLWNFDKHSKSISLLEYINVSI